MTHQELETGRALLAAVEDADRQMTYRLCSQELTEWLFKHRKALMVTAKISETA